MNFLKLFSVLFLLVLISASAFASVDLNSSLVVWWKLDEASGTTVNNEVGNNGTSSNATVNQTGLINKAYSFNGSNTTITSATGSISGNPSFSYSFWFKTSDVTRDHGIIQPTGTGGTGSNTEQTAYYIRLSNGKVFINLYQGQSIETTDGSLFTNNTWHHVVVTKASGSTNGTTTIYVDGSSKALTYTVSGVTPNYPSGNLVVGINAGGIGSYYSGLVDGFGMWSKVLNSDEVTTLYNNGNGLDYPFYTGLAEPTRIVWNIKDADQDTHLTGVTADCNVDDLDFASQNSPVTSEYVEKDTSFSCSFSRTGYDSNTSFVGIVDANKDITIYLSDTTAPTVGTTTANGFNTDDGYIWGTGTISATASDTGSGLNTSTCEYTINNGSSWTSADWNGTHCYKSYTIVTEPTNQFNIRIKDAADNQGTGTATIEYDVDLTAPITSATASQISGYTKARIQVSCSDDGIGCDQIIWRVNAQDWNSVTASTLDINFGGSGTHTLYYYGKDKANNTETTKELTFVISPDVTAPTLVFVTTPVTAGFVSDFNVGLTLTCYDNRLDDINFVFTNTINGVSTVLSNTQDTNGATKHINTLLTVGSNQITGRCIDYSGNTAQETSATVYAMQFNLINEETGATITNLNDLNVGSVQAFTYDGNNVYNYNLSPPGVKLFLDFDNTVRFDISYTDLLETKISRELNFSLLPDQNIGICVAPFQSLYEQFFLSSTNKQVIIYNDFAKCYNLASSTKFAYENALMVRAFTINKPYYLYTWIGGVKSLLATIDGSKENVINLDVLEFNQGSYSIEIATDTVVFKCLENTTTGKCDQNTMQIYYKSLRGTNTLVNFKIYKENTLLFETSESVEPNEFQINFYYGDLDLNIEDVLKLVVTRTASDSDEPVITNYYFNLKGQVFSGIMPGPLAVIFSFLLLFVGLTLVAYRYAFGWFGLILCVIAISLLSFAPGFWYVQFMQAIIVIVAVFIAIIYQKETKGVN